jgi:SAM-dependent methyltransferase
LNPRDELITILCEVGPENIWRPVYDNENVLLADGIADMRDGSPGDISAVDFHEKTVLDLGCNFGFYSFLAKRLGAKRVLGVDSNARVIKGCELLKAIHKIQGVSFHLGDLTASNLPGRFDIAMLINFIGKKMVAEGIKKVLDAVEHHSLNTMIISARAYYRIPKHLGGNAERIIRHYTSTYLKGDKFHLISFIHDYFHERWDMSVISADRDDPDIKRTLLFTRK